MIFAYWFDNWLLKLAVVAQELYIVDNLSFYAVVLSLASTSTIMKLLSLNSPDVGNMSDTVLSLVFLRLRWISGWRDRAAYSLVLIIFFTSFQKLVHTIIFNKRNNILETVGAHFILPNNDVFYPLRLTSDTNEHTHGGCRSVKRRFNISKLIFIE